MLWGIPVWLWVVFFISRIFWIVAGGVAWYFLFPKVLWNEKIEEKYLGSLKDKQTEESKAQKG